MNKIFGLILFSAAFQFLIKPFDFQLCQRSLDIAILVDVSSYICATETTTLDTGCQAFGEIIYQVSSFLDGFDIGDSRVSLTSIGNTARINWPLNGFNDRVSLIKAISNIKYIPGEKTATTDALRLLRTNIFVESNGDRPAFSNVAIIISASNPNPYDASAFSTEIQNLRASNIDVFLVVISPVVDMSIMRQVASPPQLEGLNWFRITSDFSPIRTLFFKICGNERSFMNLNSEVLFSFNNFFNGEDLETGLSFQTTFNNERLGKNIVSMDVDPVNKNLFFIEHDYPAIVSFSLLTRSVSVNSIGGASDLRSVAVDHIGRKLYYSDAGAKKIFQSNIFDLTSSSTVVTDGIPWTLDFSAQQNELYWTDCSPTAPGIYKKQMSGFTSTIPIVTLNIRKPTAMIIDFIKGIIYWGDSELRQLMKCNLDGSGVVVIDKTAFSYFHSLALYKNNLFISDSSKSFSIYETTTNKLTSLNQNKIVLSMTTVLNIGYPIATTTTTTTTTSTRIPRRLISEASQPGRSNSLMMAIVGSLLGIALVYFNSIDRRSLVGQHKLIIIKPKAAASAASAASVAVVAAEQHFASKMSFEETSHAIVIY